MGGRDGKWVDRQMHCGMNGWVGEKAKGADRDRQTDRQTDRLTERQTDNQSKEVG